MMENIAKGTLPYFLGMDLADLAEAAPLSEEAGAVEFQAEARNLAAAVNEMDIGFSKVKDQRIRALFIMRAFYLLGVIRGGEAARSVLLDETAEPGKFSLSRACAMLFLDELKGMNSLALEAICQRLGI